MRSVSPLRELRVWSLFSTIVLFLSVVWTGSARNLRIAEGDEAAHRSGGGGAARLCPVSSNMNFHGDGYFRYPLDLFDPALLQRVHKQIKTLRQAPSTTTAAVTLSNKLFNCTSEKGKIFNVEDTAHPKHICAPQIPAACPLIAENTVDVGRRAEAWLYNDSVPFAANPFAHKPPLLHVWQAMVDPEEEIHVFVLGGSSPQGADSQGCSCDARYDKKCSGFAHSRYRRARTGSAEECRWGNFFVRWLQSVSVARVRVTYLTIGGTTAGVGLGALRDELAHGNFTLRSSDLVLIDYSMNDALVFFKVHLVFSLEQAWERLIRAILFELSSKSERPPAVIMMESYPFAGYTQSQPYVDFTPAVDIATSYSRLARHYSLPILSMRDVLWSNASLTKQRAIHAELLARDHPFWYQHLFFADVYANWMQREFQRCVDFTARVYALSGAERERAERVLDPLDVQTSRSLSPPPPPLVDKNAHYALCDPRVPPLLDLRATDFLSPSLSSSSFSSAAKRESSLSKRTPIGNFSVYSRGVLSHAGNVWRVYADSKAKVGWIDEFPTRDTFPSPSLSSPADKSDRAVENTLIFEPVDPQQDLTQHAHLVTIEYLRTYENAGVGRFSVCGETSPHDPVENALDSLWRTHQTDRFSLSEIASKAIDPVSAARCLEQQQRGDDKALFFPDASKHYLRVSHVPASDGEDESTRRARTDKQKLKILGVKICRLAVKQIE